MNYLSLLNPCILGGIRIESSESYFQPNLIHSKTYLNIFIYSTFSFIYVNGSCALRLKLVMFYAGVCVCVLVYDIDNLKQEQSKNYSPPNFLFLMLQYKWVVFLCLQGNLKETV